MSQFFAITTNNGYELKVDVLNKNKSIAYIEAAELIDHTFNDIPINTWVIGMVYVNPDNRNKGLFKKLMYLVEELIKSKGSQMIILSPDETSDIPHGTLVKIYSKLGYEHYWEQTNYMYKWI